MDIFKRLGLAMLLAVLALSGLSGCATSNGYPTVLSGNRTTGQGAVIGGVAGAGLALTLGQSCSGGLSPECLGLAAVTTAAGMLLGNEVEGFYTMQDVQGPNNAWRHPEHPDDVWVLESAAVGRCERTTVDAYGRRWVFLGGACRSRDTLYFPDAPAAPASVTVQTPRPVVMTPTKVERPTPRVRATTVPTPVVRQPLPSAEPTLRPIPHRPIEAEREIDPNRRVREIPISRGGG